MPAVLRKGVRLGKYRLERRIGAGSAGGRLGGTRQHRAASRSPQDHSVFRCRPARPLRDRARSAHREPSLSPEHRCHPQRRLDGWTLRLGHRAREDLAGDLRGRAALRARGATRGARRGGRSGLRPRASADASRREARERHDLCRRTRSTGRLRRLPLRRSPADADRGWHPRVHGSGAGVWPAPLSPRTSSPWG